MQQAKKMAMRGRFTITSLVPMTLIALLTATPLPAEDDTGERLYQSKGCYQCHGYAGQGGSAGPRLAPQPIPVQAFMLIVRKPPNVMPAYSPKVLSDDELQEIYRFVASLE